MPARRKVSRKRKSTQRRIAPKRKTTRKKPVQRRTTKIASSEERQLAVYHNPFSKATKQPKIPDGKMTESLGFQTQAVGELICTNGGTTPTGVGDMDIMLFAGQNCGLLAQGDIKGSYIDHNVSGQIKNAAQCRKRIVGFEGSNDINFTSVNANGGKTQFEDEYAYWRLVSQGLRLNLLNSVEEDDGWWEAVRVKEPLNTNDWALMTRGSVDDRTQGAMVPAGLIGYCAQQDFVNQNSYTTGLLRDLHKHTFSLNPIMDHHDFQQQMEDIVLLGDDCDSETSGNAGRMLTFKQGGGSAQRLINQTVDASYDMIYIRIHGRQSGSSTRLHYNVTSNQEVVFPSIGRESRFHTNSGTVTNMAEHANSRSQQNTASHAIPPGM